MAEHAREYILTPPPPTHACELCMHQNGGDVLGYTK